MSTKSVDNQFNIAGDFNGVVGDYGVVNNHSSSDMADVLAALNVIMRETDAGDAAHLPIRAAASDVQLSLEKGEKPAVDRLEQAVKAATIADKTTKALHTAVGTVVDYLVSDGGNSAP